MPDYPSTRGLEDGLCGWVATVLLLVLVARAAQLWIVHIGCEQTWDDGAVQLARDIHYHDLGGPIYTDFRQPPYYALEYGPTIPVLASLLTGPSGSGVLACLRMGRGLTIAFTFAVWLMMMTLARQFSSRQAAAIAVLGFGLTPVFFPTFSEFRVDMPALLLELAGLYAFSAGLDLVALILFAAAFMTKPTYVAGIAAAAGLSLQRGERWHAVRFAAGWLVIVVTSLAVIQWSNPLYLLNTMASHVPLWDPAAPPQLLGKILLAMVPLVVLALVGLRRRASPMNLVTAYTIAAFASCGVAALRWGSDLNYFIELAAAISILSACGLDHMLAVTTSLPRPWQAAIGVALAVILAIPALVSKKLALRSLSHLEIGLPAESCDAGWNPEVFRVLAKTDGPILTDLPDISLRLSGQVWAPELDVLGSMRARGLFDDSYLIDSVAKRKIAAIVLGPGGLDAGYRDRGFFWPQLRQAIEQNYSPLMSGDQPYLWTPKH